MVRVLLYLVALAALAFGLAQVADIPGVISLKWPWWPLYGKTLEIAPIVAGTAALVAFVVFYIVVALLRFVFRIPSLMSFTARARREKKGVAAVSRGMIAAGAGDARTAQRAAREATKLLGQTPLALLLQAQAAQLAGDRQGAEDAFKVMKENPETRVIGLRGLYLEARRSGDEISAYNHALEAHALAPLPWAGQAILEKHAMGDDWRGALQVVEANIARKVVDKATGSRQRAVLKTGIAQDIAGAEPEEALQLVREAIKLAPDLIPAYVLAGRLLARKGDVRRGARILETGWKAAPHPEIAAAYIDLRPGDSAADRLARAQTLSRLNSGHAESMLMLARTALEARNYALARKTLAPLLETTVRPTVRTCLLMADIEETENGPSGKMREWLARAARAPRDPLWIADGFVSDTWSPASPVTGKLDAFVWETPAERLAAPIEPIVAEDEAEPAQALAPTLPAPVAETVPVDAEAAAHAPIASAPLASAPLASVPTATEGVTATGNGIDLTRSPTMLAAESVPAPAEPQAAEAAGKAPETPAPDGLALKATPKIPAGQPDDPGPR